MGDLDDVSHGDVDRGRDETARDGPLEEREAGGEAGEEAATSHGRGQSTTVPSSGDDA